MSTRDDELKENLDLFEGFEDSEFYEAFEDEEALKKGKLSENEFQKNKYIRKTRENLSGGDA